jgi:hypothetical protein
MIDPGVGGGPGRGANSEAVTVTVCGAEESTDTTAVQVAVCGEKSLLPPLALHVWIPVVDTSAIRGT